ncbi:hypothetical protein [Leisingera sp. M658]|uniref:hypothetical protein n=1 Tax=Leisingera sp. M658 TaxID=2867015 RepID=UPI0021A3E51D|nr:hypothetical protein [Leisingera sp. M658]UWQ74274.1 hypothetical protein K3724_17465 [Leisingera sp. M658]
MMADAAAHLLPQPAGAGGALQQALNRLAETPAAIRARVQQAAAGQEPLAVAVLREISETVLPRELTICVGQQSAAVLTIAQRRLTGLTLCRSADPADGAEDPDAAARIFAARLRTLDAVANGAGFTIKRRPCKATEGAGSCTAKMLSDAMGATGNSSPLDRFHARATPQAEAWMSCGRGGNLSGSGGPEELLCQLDAVRTVLAAQGAFPSAARMPAPKLECLLLPVSPQRCIIVVSVCGEQLLLTLRADAADAVLRMWTEIFPGS